MKKAVFDARWILPTPSGIGVCARELASRLPALLPDWTFVFLCRDEASRERLVACLPAAGEGRMATRSLGYGPASPRNQLLLPAELRALRAGLFHSPNFLIPFSAFPKGRPGRIRCIATIHDVIPLVVPGYAPRSRTSRFRGLYRFCLRQAARRADALVTVSERSRRDAVAALRLRGADAARIRVVPNGVDDAFFALAGARPPVRGAADRSERTVLYVGRSDPYKNVPMLVEAFAAARARAPFPMRLVVAGARDPRYPEAEARARALGVADAVAFAGALPFGELLGLYRTADLLAHPSRYEGFGLQIAEAFAAGLPVLCTDGGAAPEVAGDAARIVPLEGGAKAFAEEMLALLRDPEALGRLRGAGLRRARDFTWDRAARAVAACYGEVAAP